MIKSDIYNIFNGVDQAYVYIWLSKAHKVVYVGMTNSTSGTVGRSQGHFNARGTFRSRFLNHKGYDIGDVGDMILLSFPLPRKRKFTSVERSYREAIEHIVQTELQKLRGTVSPTYDVVSWVHSTCKRTNNSEVKKIANDIIFNFINNYNTF